MKTNMTKNTTAIDSPENAIRVDAPATQTTGTVSDHAKIAGGPKRPTRDPFEHWWLRLRSVPNSIPATIRARKLLKAALRAYGFQCIDLHSEPQEGD